MSALSWSFLINIEGIAIANMNSKFSVISNNLLNVSIFSIIEYRNYVVEITNKHYTLIIIIIQYREKSTWSKGFW